MPFHRPNGGPQDSVAMEIDRGHRIAGPLATNIQRLRHRHSACGRLIAPRQPCSYSSSPQVHDFAGTPAVTDWPRERVPTSESLVVLTRDKALVETLKVL